MLINKLLGGFRMEYKMEYVKKELIDYYRDKGLTIIGLNDSQGVNTTTTFFKKGLL